MGGGGRVGGCKSGWGVRVDVNEDLKFFEKFTKWGGRGCSGWGVRVDVNEELEFL